MHFILFLVILGQNYTKVIKTDKNRSKNDKIGQRLKGFVEGKEVFCCFGLKLERKDMIECPKCGSGVVVKSGFDSLGNQMIKCRGCGRRTSLVAKREDAYNCVCLNCGSERVSIGVYRSYGFCYACIGCGSCCVVEKARLSCEVEEVMELFKELKGMEEPSEIMRILRHRMYVNGELVIKPLNQEICFISDFEGVEIVDGLLGEPVLILRFLLESKGMRAKEFCERSGFNYYLLKSLLKDKRTKNGRKINRLISRQLETATGVPASIWLKRQKVK